MFTLWLNSIYRDHSAYIYIYIMYFLVKTIYCVYSIGIFDAYYLDDVDIYLDKSVVTYISR